MAHKILILGASYGSLLATKLLMAGHDVTLVCRTSTAALINDRGTVVRLRLKDEETHREIRSRDLPGRLDARTPDQVVTAQYDLCCLAMQEPQLGVHAIWTLLTRIADAKLPCLSVMNMPPLPFLKRIPGLDTRALEAAYNRPQIWERFDPDLMTLTSPDPQALRPPEEGANVLHVGLPTNFKAAPFGADGPTRLLKRLAADIAAVRLDNKDVPVKLRVHDSLYVPLAKWSMLLTGNYRCVTAAEPQSIRDAVLGDIERSRAIYEHVTIIARALGAGAEDAVPFEKYAQAAESLRQPSSAARALAAGAPMIERVDMLVKLLGCQLGIPSFHVFNIVAAVDYRLAANQRRIA